MWKVSEKYPVTQCFRKTHLSVFIHDCMCLNVVITKYIYLIGPQPGPPSYLAASNAPPPYLAASNAPPPYPGPPALPLGFVDPNWPVKILYS